MTQHRSKQRGVANLVTCTALLLAGMVSLAAGCSAADEGGEPEALGEQAEAQIIIDCAEYNNPCATYKWSGTKCVPTSLLKDGAACGGTRDYPLRGTCYLNTCCNGCVTVGKTVPPTCRGDGGKDNVACGPVGTVCENCTTDKCQIPACDGKSCNLKPVDEGGACVGTSGFCTKGSCCKGCLDGAGACAPGNTLTACGIASNEAIKCVDCSDEKPCTADACVAGRCTAPAVPPGTSCDDGNICNGVSECSGTSCQAGSALDCDDGDPCTIDSCDGKEGCKHEPDVGAACNDGDPCTTGEKCDAKAVCAGGVVNKCNDNKPCTTDACKEGACVNTPVEEGTTCNDGNGCTDVDSCDADGKCVGTGGPACDDDNPCTKNACAADICSNPFEPATTPCVFDKCTQNSHCAGTSGACVAGTPIDCDDANPCTADSCNPTQGCVNTPVTTVVECADGDACTIMDRCVDGACVGTPMACLALDACHEAGSCDPETGRCDDPRAENGKECPGGACAEGVCDPDAVVAEGGAGGASGEAGAANGGAPVGAGGLATGDAGEAVAPGDGGSAAEPVEHAFVRDPGGCSCRAAGHGRVSGGLLLAGLALLVAARRRRSTTPTEV